MKESHMESTFREGISSLKRIWINYSQNLYILFKILKPCKESMPIIKKVDNLTKGIRYRSCFNKNNPNYPLEYITRDIYHRSRG